MPPIKKRLVLTPFPASRGPYSRQYPSDLKAGTDVLFSHQQFHPSKFSFTPLSDPGTIMNWKQSKCLWSNDNLLSIGAISNLNVCVITCQILSQNGKKKKYLEIKDAICYGVDTENESKYSVYMLDRQQLESHYPDFIIPMNGRSSEETCVEILQHLVAYVHPPAGLSRCGLCDLWVQNVESCQFLEPLFTSSACSEHIHFNIRGRVIKGFA